MKTRTVDYTKCKFIVVAGFTGSNGKVVGGSDYKEDAKRQADNYYHYRQVDFCIVTEQTT